MLAHPAGPTTLYQDRAPQLDILPVCFKTPEVQIHVSAEVLTNALSAPSRRRGSEGVPGSPFTPQTYA